MLPQVAGYVAAWLRQADRAGRYPAFRAKPGLPASKHCLESGDLQVTVVSSAPARRAAPFDGYTARHLSVLEGLEAVRKRPGMYIGSTDSRGLMHCLWEIFDNAVDEALAGQCSLIEVVLHPDGSAEVRDNGRGIPVDVEPKTKLTGVELVMTRLHAGGKFGGGSYTASGGLHGVGASVVNALAARMDVSVDREGHEWAASFRRGVPGEFAGPGPKASFTSRPGLRQLSKVDRKSTRLNSSHMSISYAVFCLKKKKNN